VGIPGKTKDVDRRRTVLCADDIVHIYGSFPVPFMGYGASPILGYYIMILFIQEKW